MVDEVQTGFGRTGAFWGQEHFGLTPDIQMFAKGIASGFPISGIAASEAVMSKAWPGSQGGTYRANAVACAAAVATLEVIQEEGLVANAAARGAQLKAGLEEIAEKFDAVTAVHGLGLMLAVEFTDKDGEPDGAAASRAHQHAAKNGLLLLTNGMHGQNVRFIPALVVSEDEVNHALSLWEETLSAVL